MRLYTAHFETGFVSTARSLMLLENPADTALLIIGASVVASGDERNEQNHFALQRITTFGTPTGSAASVSPSSPGDPASGVTATADITAGEPTYTASTSTGSNAASSIGGWVYDPRILERAMEVSPSTDIGLRMFDTPQFPKLFVIQITFIEIGG